MNTLAPGISRNSFKKRKWTAIAAVCLAVILITGGAFVIVRSKNGNSADAVTQRTARVIRGQLIDSIAGSAPIVSSNCSELSPKVTATLQQINCKEGDQVKKGDVLFILDNTDALLNIENTKNNIAQMKLTMDSTAKSADGLLVKAPYSGQITNINVKPGDNVNKGGNLLTITDVSKLNVTLPFSDAAVKNVFIGQSVVVHLPDIMYSVNGTVTYKSSRPYSSVSGVELYNVEITVDNPGSLTEGMKASAEITVNDTVLDSMDTGKLSYVNKKAIKSDAGGTVTSLSARENEFVNMGEVLVQLENDDLLLTSSTNNIKMESLKSQLEIQQKQLSYYTITAPFDGTITSMGSANEGDTVKQGEKLAVISDMSHLEFSIAIDELDISQIEVGQKVEITAEALEETQKTPLSGTVCKVAMEGSSSNGVTTYPVTVSVDDNADGKLKTGMNIDAEIFISNKPDVLMIPVEAIVKMGDRSFVYVKGLDEGDQNSQSNQSSRNIESSQNNQSSQNGQNGQNTRNRQNNFNRPDGTAGSAWSGGTVSGGSSNRTYGRGSTGDAASGTGADGTPGQPAGSAGTEQARDGQTDGASGQPVEGAGTQKAQSGQTIIAQRANRDPYYDGATLVEVKTGISNNTYIEIISGLVQGQEVVLPKTSSSSGSNTNSRNIIQRFQNGGIMGGEVRTNAMPYGGGPGGF